MLREEAAVQSVYQFIKEAKWDDAMSELKKVRIANGDGPTCVGSFVYLLVRDSYYSEVETLLIKRVEEIQKEEKGKNTAPKEIENKVEVFLRNGGIRMIELAARENKKSPREIANMLTHFSRISFSYFHTELKDRIKIRYSSEPLNKMFAAVDRIAAIPKVTPLGGVTWVGDDDLRTCVLFMRYLNQPGCEFIFPLVIWHIIFDYVLSPHIVESHIPFKCQFFSNVLSESELKKARSVDFIRSYSSTNPNLSAEQASFLNNLSHEILLADSDEAVHNVIVDSRSTSSGSHEALLVHLQSVYPSNGTEVVVASTSSSSVNDERGKRRGMDENDDGRANKFHRGS